MGSTWPLNLGKVTDLQVVGHGAVCSPTDNGEFLSMVAYTFIVGGELCAPKLGFVNIKGVVLTLQV